MNLLITRTLPQKVLDAARARFDTTVHEGGKLSPDEARAALSDYDLIIPTLGDAFGAAAFEGPAPRTRVLANFGVGYNHIDAPAARAAGVEVTNTPGVLTDATADIAMTLLLMAARRASEGERVVRAGAWKGWTPTQMLGLHVTGKTVGIVGMGRIGKAVAKRCHYGFDMPVVFHNRSAVADPGMPARQLGSLSELMAAADIVVVCVPGGAETRHLIDAAVLSHMQPHAVFVNIARGDVVDEAALIAALQERRIAAAGLDVYENEPEVPEALRALENTALLPHLGTAALEIREAMGMLALDNATAVAEGRSPPNPV
ncbi:2-hydroxyacid dehydrogenase [Anianabacter salinae]|uniref:2-hydroxyacid dehydrogenase n=1 Tax=Anianabacter salinae TaxID=2851023 RepID=UPI00225DED04|nr:D-glycerate dehydrogenase [Anianabacter salinae]MBV0912623.1 D-glycerate dehydrogenase [Anianabacter salinae]